MRIARLDSRWRMLSFGRVVHDCLEKLALQQGYRVGAMCEVLGVSESYLRELFLRDVGLTPKEWMRWERMVVARRMLRCGQDPRGVGETLGFSDPNSFRREFRNVYGIPPLGYLKLRRPDDA